MTTTTKRVIVAAVAVCLAVVATVTLTSAPALAATCTTGAHQDANGRWHNPNGQFCAHTGPTTTRPPATTCPPRTTTTAPVTTLPPKPCPTTMSTSTTRPEATTTTVRDPGCLPDDAGRYRDEHGQFCSHDTTTTTPPADPGTPVPPVAVRALPRFTG